MAMPVFTYPYQVVTVQKWDGNPVLHHEEHIYDCYENGDGPNSTNRICWANK